MRFKVAPLKEPKHGDVVSCVGWSSTEDVLSVGDDQRILSWNLFSNESRLIANLPDHVFATNLHWCPVPVVSGKKQLGLDIFALSSSDGKFYLISKIGRIEKAVDAHTGAVLTARWCHDGSALATGGEDGQVKIWSKSGMLRSTLVQTGKPVYSIDWSSDSGSLLYTSGKSLVIKSLQPSSKPLQWHGHDGIILKVSWNANNNLILSGGEDCRYKLWDIYGRALYSSPLQDHPVTSLAWTPDGELFAVGSFSTLRLCDKVGWSHCLEKPETGSIFNLSWSADGTQVSGACGNGQVIFAHLVERRLEWKNYEAEITGRKLIIVRNVADDAWEKLEMQSHVLKVSLAHRHLIVITTSQCLIYSIKNWNTPIIFDLKESGVNCIIQADKHFMLIEGGGVSIYSYDGKALCTPRWPGMRPEVLNQSTVSLNNYTLAIRDQADEKVIHLFDASTGKVIGDGKPMSHQHEVMTVALNQCGPASTQYIAYIDRNNDLYLDTVRTYKGPRKKTMKLAVMVHSICWNDSSNMLAALQEGKMTLWYCPSAVFVDRSLFLRTANDKDSVAFGKNPHLISFLGNQVNVRCADGSLISAAVSPFPSVLHGYVSSTRWDDAIRLCRLIKEEALWACLATLAIQEKNVHAAEVAYAALEEVDKVEFLQQLSNIAIKEIHLSEMALLSGNTHEAEAVLLQGGYIFSAIMLNVNLMQWDRALELALKHTTHVDTVLAHRKRYLVRMDQLEEKVKFKELANQVQWDWENVKSKMDAEYAKQRRVSTVK